MELDNNIDNTETHDTDTCLRALASAFTADPEVFSLTYLAEGNANIIYNTFPNLSQPQQPSPQTAISNAEIRRHSQCAVLRLRKALAFTKPSIEVLSAFSERIVPLFSPEHTDVLMPQILVRLTSTVVDGLNAMLYTMEDDTSSALSRPVARRGAYLPFFTEEPHGILMPNLHARGERLFEFKPKWLVQSPSAPSDARRCRTCAVNLLRRMKGKQKGRGDSGFCPFALLSHDDGVLRPALEQLFGGRVRTEIVEEFVGKVQPLLRYLRELQKRLGGVGLQDFQSSEVKDLGVAMALRDCSVFLVLSDRPEASNSAEIKDVKFADLDIKATDGGKTERWTEVEGELLSKGLYADDVDADDGYSCFLR